MKLYLSSIRIPTPGKLEDLIGKSLPRVSVALIPNAQDYYAPKAWEYKVSDMVSYLEDMGMKVKVTDLREYKKPEQTLSALAHHDLVWAMGGNTFCLRYEMKQSGFNTVIHQLLEDGVVYGGDSAGALVAGQSIAGIESADIPEFAEEVIEEGLRLVPYVVLPHTDNDEFAEAVLEVRRINRGKHEVIELTDAQAVIFEADKHTVY